ncbi:dipeptidase [Raoultibacter phocaeensis]|uniref:dipeptidase n=1 Tax=Raoultibacter phocaeensis TaxID=2479841 RepID=UPI0021020300|nr:membrane dipeptidase [Raoultibacter phocaeensis]
MNGQTQRAIETCEKNEAALFDASANPRIDVPFEGAMRIFDLHCDTLDRLALHASKEYPPFAPQDKAVPHERMSSLVDNDAHISLDVIGAYAWCQCFAVFVPDELRGDAAWDFFEYVRAYFDAQMAAHANRVEQVRDARRIPEVLESGKTAALLTVEGGAFFDGTSLERIERIAQAGVRMLTLTWNGENAVGSGHDTTQGLTAYGKRVVAALEGEKIVVDVSHLNDRGFSDVCDVATRPFAASHSNARAVCGHKRNLTDAQIRAIAEAGGIVGLNFCTQFLSEAHADPSRDDVLRHIDRICEVGGEDVLALGSDYDGCDVPSWLVPASKVGSLHALIADHFGRRMADKACFDNALAFFERNEVL